MINIYRKGLVHCSVCVPKEMERKAIEAEVNEKTPTGLDHGWEISGEHFRTGENNPCACNKDETRLHYLLVC